MIGKVKKFVEGSIKWRKLNLYICLGCQKKRSTFFYKKAKEAMCRNCKKVEVNENQTVLFK